MFLNVDEFAPVGPCHRCRMGPPVAAIGWIPFHDSPEEFDGAPLATHWASTLAVPVLFRSGNRQPPVAFSGPGGFAEDLKLRDFRAAISIDEPKIYVARDGSVAGFTFQGLSDVGCTPARCGAATYYIRGTKRADWSIELGRDFARLWFWIKVKVGWLPDVTGMMLTGHLAPWAVMLVDYTLWTDGRVMIEVSGSRIPSQSIYLGWNLTHTYEMEGCSVKDFEGFVSRGACKDALIQRIYWTRRL